MQLVLDPINVGVIPNDRKGDDERTSWSKQNAMNAGIADDLTALYDANAAIGDLVSDKLDKTGDSSTLTLTQHAIARTLLDRATDYVSVRDFALSSVSWFDGTLRTVGSIYGALAACQAVYPHVTSVNDSYAWAALQAAINYAQANPVAGYRIEIDVAAGRYHLGTNVLVVPGSFIGLRCRGRHNAVFVNNAGRSGYTLSFDAGAGNKIYWNSLRGIAFESEGAMTAGSSSTTGIASGHIFVRNGDKVLFEDVRGVDGYVGLDLFGCGDYYVWRCQFVNGPTYTGSPALAGMRLMPSQDISGLTGGGGWIDALDVRSTGDDGSYVRRGLSIHAGDGVWCDKTHLGNATEADLLIESLDANGYIVGLIFGSLWCDQNSTGDGVYIKGETANKFGGIKFDSACYIAGGASSGIGFFCDSPVVYDVKFQGDIVSWGGDGVQLSRGNWISFTSMKAKGNGRIAGHGIRILAGIKHVDVLSCQIGGSLLGDTATQQYPIVIVDGADYINVGECSIWGNQNNTVLDLSTTTHKTIRQTSAP